MKPSSEAAPPGVATPAQIADAAAAILLAAGVSGPEQTVAVFGGNRLEDLVSLERLGARLVVVGPLDEASTPLRHHVQAAPGTLPLRSGEADAIVVLDGSAGRALDESEYSRALRDLGLLVAAGEPFDPGLAVGRWQSHGRQSDDAAMTVLRRIVLRNRTTASDHRLDPSHSGPEVAASADPVLGLSVHLASPLVLVDGGCRDGFHDRWARVGGHAQVIGFDPDADECRRLEQAYAEHPAAEFVAAALGAESATSTVHVPNAPAGSSFMAPDFEGTSHLITTDGAQPNTTFAAEIVRLDEWIRERGIRAVDCYKLDVEGFELEALRGSEATLATVSVLEIEVRLNPTNIGAPMFGQVDHFLRQRGFVLWRLRDLAHYGLRGTEEVELPEHAEHHFYQRSAADIAAVPVMAPPGQLVWCNAVWVSDELVRGGHDSWVDALRAALAARVFDLDDLSWMTLRRMVDTDLPTQVHDDVVSALVQMGARASR